MPKVSRRGGVPSLPSLSACKGNTFQLFSRTNLPHSTGLVTTLSSVGAHTGLDEASLARHEDDLYAFLTSKLINVTSARCGIISVDEDTAARPALVCEVSFRSRTSAGVLSALFFEGPPKSSASVPGAGLSLGTGLVLVRGPSAVSTRFLEWATRRFDCAIGPLHLPPFRMNELAAGLLAACPGSPSPVQLVYEPPGTVAGVTRLTVSVPAASVARLAKAALGRGEGGIDVLVRLGRHFDQYFAVDVACLRLLRCATPHVVVGSDGKLKFLSCPEDTIRETLAMLAQF